MSEHKIEVVAEGYEFRLRLVCTAAPGAPCRKRPSDDRDDREEWNASDPDLIDGECWAVEWVDETTFDEAVSAGVDGVWATIPVKIEYDDGVVVSRVDPQPDIFDAMGLDPLPPFPTVRGETP